MATQAPVNVAPSERSPVGSSPMNSFLWQPDSPTMHLVRPKSAKGRTRPSLQQPQGSHHAPSTSPPALPCELPSGQKPGASMPRSLPQGAPDELPELPQLVPVGTTSSLNRYRVLPSISRKALEEGAAEMVVAKEASSLQPSSVQALSQEDTCAAKTREEDARPQASSPEQKLLRTKSQSCCQAGGLEEPSEHEPRLLLAVRSPSGRRFVRHFRPTDALQTVVAVAELENKTSYRHCSVETMEVPRRCFSDLSKSLQECRIPHKSVLGILQQPGAGWP